MTSRLIDELFHACSLTLAPYVSTLCPVKRRSIRLPAPRRAVFVPFASFLSRLGCRRVNAMRSLPRSFADVYKARKFGGSRGQLMMRSIGAYALLLAFCALPSSLLRAATPESCTNSCADQRDQCKVKACTKAGGHTQLHQGGVLQPAHEQQADLCRGHHTMHGEAPGLFQPLPVAASLNRGAPPRAD